MLVTLLPVAFFLVAVLYASVGFGGGSTYTALLVLAEIDYRLIPVVSLICNILVVSGSCWRYHAADLLPVRRLAPAMLVSVPLAWLGGLLPIGEDVFVLVLGLSLAATGGLLLIQPRLASDQGSLPEWLLYPVGAGAGFLAGLVGIGGGIFLAPILYLIRWASEREIAAAASLFILVNSSAGLAGQLMGLDGADGLQVPNWVYSLPIIVLIGGWLGNRLGIAILPVERLRQATALLILIVAARLLYRSFLA
ncbi:MAG: sulfite exporter TauE/SafE family protein [Alphaproteobacteria bacterium]|nr:sulfite exporter TauE/SafE family protein [Alphaproteobacteria bacterium]